MTVQQRFDAKWTPEPFSGCWLWTAYVNHRGYGRMIMDGVVKFAHRIAWLLYVGPLATDKQICHTCDTPACVNPDHLWAGTAGENLTDSITKGRRNYHTGGMIWESVRDLVTPMTRTTCLRGHSLNAENLYITPNGRSDCRACRRLACRKSRSKSHGS